jgi:hypothetical protein
MRVACQLSCLGGLSILARIEQAIQILKRHRDVVFKDNPEWAPISMIITILAAKSYQGERTVKDAVEHIVDRMPQFVNASKPRIPNPVNPSEDFADRWAAERRYEENFWVWHTTVKAKLANLPEILAGGNVAAVVRKLFKVDLTEKQHSQDFSHESGWHTLSWLSYKATTDHRRLPNTSDLRGTLLGALPLRILAPREVRKAPIWGTIPRVSNLC